VYSRHVLKLGFFKSILFLYRNYYSFGQSLIDKVAVGAGLSAKYDFEFENSDVLDILSKKDSGVVIIGAHFGSWEVGAPFFNNYGSRLNLVMFDNEDENIKKVLSDNITDIPDYTIIPVNKDNLEHVFKIAFALENNELVSFQGDRFVNDEKVVKTDFMGIPAAFPQGPFLVASKFKVPVIYYFAVREKGRKYKFIFKKATISDSESDGKSVAEAYLKQYVSALETEVGKYPEQWYNFYDFWNLC
jgi:predicted LPLAT superfamily acyltransferase